MKNKKKFWELVCLLPITAWFLIIISIFIRTSWLETKQIPIDQIWLYPPTSGESWGIQWGGQTHTDYRLFPENPKIITIPAYISTTIPIVGQAKTLDDLPVCYSFSMTVQMNPHTAVGFYRKYGNHIDMAAATSSLLLKSLMAGKIMYVKWNTLSNYSNEIFRMIYMTSVDELEWKFENDGVQIADLGSMVFDPKCSH